MNGTQVSWIAHLEVRNGELVDLVPAENSNFFRSMVVSYFREEN
jgi:hypothetical protein